MSGMFGGMANPGTAHWYEFALGPDVLDVFNSDQQKAQEKAKRDAMEAAQVPPVPAPTPMPTERTGSRRRSISDSLRRRGRASTILTDDALGG